MKAQKTRTEYVPARRLRRFLGRASMVRMPQWRAEWVVLPLSSRFSPRCTATGTPFFGLLCVVIDFGTWNRRSAGCASRATMFAWPRISGSPRQRYGRVGIGWLLQVHGRNSVCATNVGAPLCWPMGLFWVDMQSFTDVVYWNVIGFIYITECYP